MKLPFGIDLPSWRRFAACAVLGAFLAIAVSPLFAQGPLPAPLTGTFGPPFATSNGHTQFGGGAPPTLSTCGTGPQGPFGTDTAFHFVTGTSAGGVCTITPAKPYAARPTCSVDTESTTLPAFTVNPNGSISLNSGVQDSTRYMVICFAQPGGM